nr:hypothetical protein [Tanacetum cinerariifolium]
EISSQSESYKSIPFGWKTGLVVGIQVDHQLEEMMVQQALNQIREDLLVTVEKHRVFAMIVDESLEMIKDKSLEMIEDKSLKMLVEGLLEMIEDESHDIIVDRTL